MSILLERITKNICNIVINRPAKRNALNLELIKQLRGAIEDFERDEHYKVAILSGVGGNFCSGYDLNDVIDSKTGMANLHKIEQMLLPLGTNLSDKKIIIASIEGHAAGFGYELALRCDFRVSERDSRMGFMNRRFGVPIMNGGTVILPRLIGQARAMELIATGKAQLAPQALEFGLLFQLSDVGCAMGQAVNLARNLSKFEQASLLHDLRHVKVDANEEESVVRLLEKERRDSLEFLKHGCGPLKNAVKFLEGQIGRHGSTDLGNLLGIEPSMTL